MKYTTWPLSCVSMVEEDDAKFKVVDNCKGTLLMETIFNCSICMTRGHH